MNTRIIAFLSLIMVSSVTFAQDIRPGLSQQPVMLKADDLNYDQVRNMLVARGNVQIYQGQDLLTADEVTYDRGLDKMMAKGHVVWQKETGDVFFGSSIELTDRMKDGVIRDFKGHLADASKLAANHGFRRDGKEIELSQAVYSPCKVCRKNPGKSPLWQIKAETVLWDEEAHDIIYTDARLEFFGVPVLYTPYLRHADPTVKQRSGILAPTFNASEDLGFYAYLPYYYVISPDKDITLVPLITSKKGNFLSGEYRQRFRDALLNLGGSIGSSEKLRKGKMESVVRGHVDSKLYWELNEDWRMKAHILRASDATYFRQFPIYGYVNENVLTSQVQAERFEGLSYLRIQAMSFQGMRDVDRQKTIPVVGPAVDYRYVSPRQVWDSRFFVDANTLAITRQTGTNMQRVSSAVTWKVPFATNLGDVYAFSLKLRGDGYNRKNYSRANTIKRSDGTTGRVLPQAFVEWEYPWLKKIEGGHVILSPAASLVVAPKLRKQNHIPNEDCVDIEPNDLYLLSDNRFPGLDRLDDGSRFNYGLKAQSRVSKNIKVKGFVGQTMRFSGRTDDLIGSGFEKKMSDYMGRISTNLYEYVELRYRFRLDRSSLRAVRNELMTSLGVPEFKVSMEYIKLPRFVRDPINQTGNEQLSTNISSVFAKGWTARIGNVRELGKRKKNLSYTGALTYDNECINTGLQVTQTYYRDRDVKGGTGFMFVLAFKTLGGQTLHAIKFNKLLTQDDSPSARKGLFN